MKIQPIISKCKNIYKELTNKQLDKNKEILLMKTLQKHLQQIITNNKK